ncbi:MAG: DUF2938 domain-containing protein [Erythrobacter sp.]
MDSILLDAIVIGCGATLTMDIMGNFLDRVFGIRPLDYRLVGRWCHSLTKGRVFHRPIAGTQPVRYEELLGWVVHYATGVTFALVFILLVGERWVASPTPFPALAFGALTVAVPFFLIQPAFGAGIAARRMPKPWHARAKSLTAHATFGAGIWLSAAIWVSTS